MGAGGNAIASEGSNGQAYSSMIDVLERNASLEERRVKKNSAKPFALIAPLS